MNLFLKIKSTSLDIVQILWCKRECFADTGTNTIDPAAFVLGVIGKA